MRIVVALLSAALAVPAGLATAAPAGAAPAPIEGRLSAVRGLGLSGVSPHADRQPDGGVLLYYSTTEGGTAADRCTAAGSCVRAGLLPGINDLTVVTLATGERRGYFVQFDPATRGRAMYTALLAADGLSYSDPRPLGISSAPDQRAWGVPDAVVLPDGRVRLYWVDTPTGASRPGEAIVSATSTDGSGTVFVRDPGLRTVGGIVDFEVLRAAPGDWVAIASTTPGSPPQGLVLARSADGLRWRVNRDPISPAGANYLDPTGFPVGRRTYRVYFSVAPLADPFGGFQLKQALLTVRR